MYDIDDDSARSSRNASNIIFDAWRNIGLHLFQGSSRNLPGFAAG
jgi:hypothetical protein